MSDEDDFAKFQPDKDDEIVPIDLSDRPAFRIPPQTPEPASAPARQERGIDDAAALGDIKTEEKKKKKTKRLADGTEVPDDLADYFYDEDLNRMVKGDYVDLLAKVPSLRHLTIAVGWENKSLEEQSIDVDLSLFLLDKNGQTRVDSDFLFYNNQSAADGAVKHMGDNRVGAGDGDNETVLIDISGVSFDVQRIVVVLSVYDEALTGFHLGQVHHLFLRLVNAEDGIEICRYMIEDEKIDGLNAMRAVALIREGAKWYAEVMEELTNGGLQEIAKSYGIIVQEDTG